MTYLCLFLITGFGKWQTVKMTNSGCHKVNFMYQKYILTKTNTINSYDQRQ